jgi:RNA polymerase sigma factor (sigma-70 family)
MTASLKAEDGKATAGGQPQSNWTVVTEPTNDLLRSAWEEVAPQLARLVGAMGIGHGRREDVLQDVYLAAFQKGPAGADPTQLRRWLIRVTVNRCHLEQRRTSRWRAVWHGLAARLSRRGSEGSEAAASQAEEEREFVQRALARIRPEARSLLVLRYFLEFDSAEIGKILGQSDSTIRGQLREARKLLAWELKRAGYHNE